jgi:cell division GTPase FtsZ
MVWITVTQANGEPLLVNMDYAIAIAAASGGGSTIQWAQTNGQTLADLKVMEDALAIKEKIRTEYRQALQHPLSTQIMSLSSP